MRLRGARASAGRLIASSGASQAGRDLGHGANGDVDVLRPDRVAHLSPAATALHESGPVGHGQVFGHRLTRDAECYHRQIMKYEPSVAHEG